MKFLLGCEIFGIRSTKMEIFSNNGVVEGVIIDYNSELRLVDSSGKNKAQLITIESKWEEFEDYSDNLEIKFNQGGEISFELPEISNRNSPPSKYYFSQNSESNSFFKIKDIEVYGYNKTFNNHNPTKHIVLFSSYGDEQILMYPMMSGIGLKVLVNKYFIDNFFNHSQGHKLIYLADKYSFSKV